MSNNKIEHKQREEGIELLRILSMFMILILHYCGKGGYLQTNFFQNLNVEIAWLLEAFSIVAVNCYVLISGYFLINSQCERKKIIKIISQVVFYSVSIFLLFKIIGKGQYTLQETLTYIFPVTLKTYWFVTCYVVLYLLAPFINKILNNATKNEMKILLSVLIGISWSSSILSYFKFDVLDTTGGYGILWFVTLYCIAGYLRLYGKEEYGKYKYLLAYIMISVFVYISRIVLLKIAPIKELECNMFYAYNSITITLSSICLFMFFKKVKIKNEWIKKGILKVAPLTFAVYIIHEHPLVRKNLYKNILHTDLFLQSKKFGMYIFLSCIGIFVISCLIEEIRRIMSKYIKIIILKITCQNN